MDAYQSGRSVVEGFKMIQAKRSLITLRICTMKIENLISHWRGIISCKFQTSSVALNLLRKW